MKKQVALIATLILGLGAFAEGPTVVTVADLIAKATNYDQKQVKTFGIVTRFGQRTSRAGNAYFEFKLKEKDQFVSIFGHGRLEKPPKDGDVAEVVGKFKKDTRVGSDVFKNEIETAEKDIKVVKVAK